MADDASNHFETLHTKTLADKMRRAQGAAEARKTTDPITTMVAEKYGLANEKLLGNSKRHPLAEARDVAMYLIREFTTLSDKEISLAFNLYSARDAEMACKRIEQVLKSPENILQGTEPETVSGVREVIDTLSQQLTSLGYKKSANARGV